MVLVQSGRTFQRRRPNAAEEEIASFLNRLPEEKYKAFREFSIDAQISQSMKGFRKKRPDFIVVGPDIGIVAIEVKNWNILRNQYLWVDQETVEILVPGQPSESADNPERQRDAYERALIDLVGQKFGIYVDALLAFAIAFNNDSDVQKLDQLLSSRGLVWGIAQGFPPANRNASLPDRYFPKRAEGAHPSEYYEEQLNALDECFKEVGARIAAFCLLQYKPSFEAHALSGVTDELALDNRYRVMLAEALEMVLFDLLPTIGTPKELRIDIATKEGTVTAKDKYSRQDLIQRFGMEFGDGKRQLMYRTTRTKDIFPIVAAVLSKRPVTAKHLPIRRARGITLVNYADKDKASAAAINPTHLRGTQLHYLADWVAHFVFRPETMPPIAKRWLDDGFIEDRNSRLSSLLESRRIADSGDSVSSLLELLRTDAGNPSDSTPYFGLILPHVIDQAKSLSPAEFWHLCALLSETR